MRVTIIPPDNRVGINGVSKRMDLSTLPEIHAVQWYGDHGEIEYRDSRRNEKITDIAPFQAYIDTWHTLPTPMEPKEETQFQEKRLAAAWIVLEETLEARARQRDAPSEVTDYIAEKRRRGQ